MNIIPAIMEVHRHIPPKTKVIMVSEVGSYMWGLNTETSDHDLFVVYSEPTFDILRGIRCPPTCRTVIHKTIEDEVYDIQFMEVEHFINLLAKGNVNALWALISPIRYYDRSCLTNLHHIIKTSKKITQIIPSVEGIVRSNIKRGNNKLAQTVLNFAYKYLTTNIFSFNPPKVLGLSTGLNNIQPFLLDEPADLSPVREWLLEYRLVVD